MKGNHRLWYTNSKSNTKMMMEDAEYTCRFVLVFLLLRM